MPIPVAYSYGFEGDLESPEEGLDAERVVRITPTVTKKTAVTCVRLYLCCIREDVELRLNGIPFVRNQPSKDHANNKPSAPEDDMHGHGYSVGECSIV